MAKINNFEELEVWKMARTICKSVEKLLRETPLGKTMRSLIKWNEVLVQLWTT